MNLTHLSHWQMVPLKFDFCDNNWRQIFCHQHHNVIDVTLPIPRFFRRCFSSSVAIFTDSSYRIFSRSVFRFKFWTFADNDVIVTFCWRHRIRSSYESYPAFPTWTVSWLIPPFNQLTPWWNYFVSIVLTVKYHLPRLSTIWLTTS